MTHTAHDATTAAHPPYLDAKPFLATHRALPACAREITRLCDDIVLKVGALHTTGADVPKVRRSPGRCIIQVGSVALTLAWLRGNLDSIEDGELLVIVWRGTIAPRGDHCPERASIDPGTATATAVWERTLVAAAESEAGWRWRRGKADHVGSSSAEVASQATEQLARAHASAARRASAAARARPTAVTASG